MRKLLLLVLVVVVMVFAFRGLMGNDVEDSDVTAQVTKDIEGEGSETLAAKESQLKTEAQSIIASAEDAYARLKGKLGDIDETSLRQKTQQRLDEISLVIDKAQEEFDNGLYEDAVGTGTKAIKTTSSYIDTLDETLHNLASNTQETYEDVLAGISETYDKTQKLRLKYAETIQEIEKLTLERSSSSDKDSYTKEINALVNDLDDINYNLNLLEASEKYYDARQELDGQKSDIINDIQKHKEKIAGWEEDIDGFYSKLEDLNKDDAYLDKEYTDIMNVVEKKEKIWNDIDERRDDIADDQNAIENLRDELYDVEEQLDAIRDIMALRQQLAQLQNNIDEIEQIIDDYDDDYKKADSSKERRDIAEKIDDMEEKINDIVDEKSKLLNYIEDLEEQIKL